MDDEFTFKNSAIRKWLFLVGIVALLLTVFAHPSFWLCGLGIVLLLTGQIANSVRTGQWWSWQNEGSLSWFEGWAATTGIALITTPLAINTFRTLKY